MKPLPGKDGCEWGSVYLHQMSSFQRRRWKAQMSRGFLILDNAEDLWTRAIAPVRVFRDEEVCSISKYSIYQFLHIFASSSSLSQRPSRARALVLHSLTCTQEMGIALRPTKSGAIIFDVAKHTPWTRLQKQLKNCRSSTGTYLHACLVATFPHDGGHASHAMHKTERVNSDTYHRACRQACRLRVLERKSWRISSSLSRWDWR